MNQTRNPTEFDPLEEEEDAMAAIYPACLTEVKIISPNLSLRTQETLARGWARSLAKRAIEQTELAERGEPEPEPEPDPEPKTAEIIQLAFWGEDYRAAPNAVFRSALFPAMNGNQKENRRYMEREEIYCVAGLKVLFTGKQFDQSDLDVYLELLNMAAVNPLGVPVKFSAHSLLKSLGLPTGGSNHARLHDVLIRLCAGTVDATDHGIRYFGQLLHGGIRDEITMNYTIHLNPEFVVLFGANMWSKLDLGVRRALSRNNTAKALHAYYSTHIEPLPHNIETLASLVGLNNSNKRQVKATILKAHEALKEAGFLSDYTLQGENIKVVIKHTPTQNRAIAKRIARAAKEKADSRRRNKPTHASDFLVPPPKKK